MRNTVLPPVPLPHPSLPQPSEIGLALLRREPLSMWRTLPRCEIPAEAVAELATALSEASYPARCWDCAILGDNEVACRIAAFELRAGPRFRGRLLDMAMSACLLQALMNDVACQAMLAHGLVVTQGAGQGLMLAAGWDLVSILTAPLIDRTVRTLSSPRPACPPMSASTAPSRSRLRLVVDNGDARPSSAGECDGEILS